MRLGEREASGVQSIDLRARRREAIQNTDEPGCLDHSFGTSQESGFTRAARELDQRISNFQPKLRITRNALLTLHYFRISSRYNITQSHFKNLEEGDSSRNAGTVQISAE